MKNYFILSFFVFFTSCIVPPSVESGSDITITPLAQTEQNNSLDSYNFHSLSEDDYEYIFDVMAGEVEDNRFREIYRPMEYEVIFSREHLLIYPDSVDLDNIKWKLAFANANAAIGRDQADIGMIEVFIAEMFSQGMKIEDIAANLEQKRVYVNDFETVTNLVGLGQDGFVILLSIPDHYYPVAAFAVYPQGSTFIVEKIFGWEVSSFPAMGRYFDLQIIGDTNENAVTEIVIQVEEGHSGIPGAESMDVYHIEWSDNKYGFEIKKFPVFSQSCNDPCKGTWEFLELNNKKALVINNYWYTRDECPNLVTERIYFWDGEEYTQEDSAIILPEENMRQECQLAWAETAISLYEEDRINKFPEGWRDTFAISIFESSLSNWPIKADEIWGPAGRDYAKLKLGIWHDLREDRQKANIVLRDLAANPYLAKYNFASILALRYLESRDTFSSTRACVEVNKFLSMELKKLPPGDFSINNDKEMLEYFGTVEWKNRLCNPNEMLSSEIASAKLNSFESLEAWATAGRINVLQQTPVDINNDEIEDHVVLIDIAENGNFDYWILFGDPDGYVSRYLTYSLLDKEEPFEIKEILLAQDKKAFVLKMNNEVKVFSSPSYYDIDVLLSEFDVESVEISSDLSPARLLINIDSEWQGRMTNNYQWDSEQKKLVLMLDTFEIAQSELNKKLFVEGDYQGVIEYVDEFLLSAPPEPKYTAYCGAEVTGGCKYLPEWYVPYFRYMKGIAYEKMGQSEDAGRIYFELWQDFPENVFGVVSSMKLNMGER